jgi:hypothetical protein
VSTVISVMKKRIDSTKHQYDYLHKQLNSKDKSKELTLHWHNAMSTSKYFVVVAGGIELRWARI